MMSSPARKLFVNLAVKDLARSIDFFARLGFRFDPKFTDDQASGMIIGENAYVMLLTEERFTSLTLKAACDADETAETVLAVAAESRADVDNLVHKALAAGAKPANETDHGFMYGWSFYDLDGHLWEIVSTK